MNIAFSTLERARLSPPPQFRFQADGFSPLFSFATGGLAEAWTGGCYPFDNAELHAFPFGYRELEPYYSEVARRRCDRRRR